MASEVKASKKTSRTRKFSLQRQEAVSMWDHLPRRWLAGTSQVQQVLV